MCRRGLGCEWEEVRGLFLAASPGRTSPCLTSPCLRAPHPSPSPSPNLSPKPHPGPEQVRLAPPAVIEEAIRPGGLAAIKTGRIQLILDTLHRERGECSLEHLHAMSDEQVDSRPHTHASPHASLTHTLTPFTPLTPLTVAPHPRPSPLPLTFARRPQPHPRPSPAQVKAELRGYKGVGAKTISCVLMFCLGRHDFPVDTHVWKIAIALGWVPKVRAA